MNLLPRYSLYHSFLYVILISDRRLRNSFIEYVKAYDQAYINLLLRLFAAKGCRNNCIQAMANSFRDTVSVLGSESFHSYRRVKQSAANSCSLFTFYINKTIETLRVQQRWIFGKFASFDVYESIFFYESMNVYEHNECIFGN